MKSEANNRGTEGDRGVNRIRYDYSDIFTDTIALFIGVIVGHLLSKYVIGLPVAFVSIFTLLLVAFGIILILINNIYTNVKRINHHD